MQKHAKVLDINQNYSPDFSDRGPVDTWTLLSHQEVRESRAPFDQAPSEGRSESGLLHFWPVQFWPAPFWPAPLLALSVALTSW